MISSIRSWICWASSTSQQLCHFSSVYGLDHQYRWHVGGHAFHGMYLCEGVWVSVELYIWKALIVLFPGSLFGPIVQAQFFSILGHPGFHVSFGWWGGKGSVLLGDGSLRTSCLAWDFARQTVWRGARPSNIHSCCHHSARDSSISAFPWLYCQQLHFTTRSLFTTAVSWLTRTHFQVPSADGTSSFPKVLLSHYHLNCLRSYL